VGLEQPLRRPLSWLAARHLPLKELGENVLLLAHLPHDPYHAFPFQAQEDYERRLKEEMDSKLAREAEIERLVCA